MHQSQISIFLTIFLFQDHQDLQVWYSPLSSLLKFVIWFYLTSDWFDQGPAGEKGDIGPMGPPGRDGEKGPRGKRGKRVSYHFPTISYEVVVS